MLGSGNYAGLSHVLGQQAVFNETHTFTPHLLNDLRLGYTRRGNTTDGILLGDPASAATGHSGNSDERGVQQCAAAVYRSPDFSRLESSPSTFSQYQTGVWQLVDTVDGCMERMRSRREWTARWYQLNAVSPPNPTGSFAFTTTGTNQPSATDSGNSFASFLLGQVDTFQIDLQQQKIRPRDHIEEFFVQDDWKATAESDAEYRRAVDAASSLNGEDQPGRGVQPGRRSNWIIWA